MNRERFLRHVPRLRWWVALSLGAATAFAVYLWPASPRATLQCERTCWHLAFSGDGTMLAALDREAGLNEPGQILVWDTATGKLLARMDYGIRVYPSKVAFAPDGKTLALVDAGTVVKWDISSGRMVAEYDHAHWSHNADDYNAREILFSPEGRWLAHNIFEGRLYDVETGQIVQDYKVRWPERNFAAHGGSVLALDQGEIRSFDARTGVVTGRFPGAIMRGTMGKTYMVASADGTLAVHIDAKGEWILEDSSTSRRWVLTGDAEGRFDCWFSDNNRYLAVASRRSPKSIWHALRHGLFTPSRHIDVFDTATGAWTGQPIRDGVRGCFAPDGTMMALTDGATNVTLWDWPSPSRWPAALGAAVGVMILSWGIAVLLSGRRKTMPPTNPHL